LAKPKEIREEDYKNIRFLIHYQEGSNQNRTYLQTVGKGKVVPLHATRTNGEMEV